MEEVKLSQANQVYVEKQKAKDNGVQNPITSPELKKDGDKKLKLALAGLAVAGTIITAGILIHKGYGKKALDTVKNLKGTKGVKAPSTKLLSDVEFEKGVAKVKGTSDKFTGVIQDTLKNGDKVTLEYSEGILQKSTREGKEALEKVYTKFGTNVEITQNGNSTSKDINKIKNAVLDSKSELETLEKSAAGDLLSVEQIKERADKIQYKSKEDKEKIKSFIDKTSKPRQLSDIDFSTGKAKKKNGMLFSGVIEDTLPSGDKVTMKYDGGNLVESTREGKINFKKTYSNNGDCVEIAQDGKTNKISIRQLKQGDNTACVNEILSQSDELTIDELKQKTYKLEHVSPKDKKRIQDTIDKKQAIIDEKAKRVKALADSSSQQELNKKILEAYDKGDNEQLELLRAADKAKQPERLKHAIHPDDVKVDDKLSENNGSWLANVCKNEDEKMAVCEYFKGHSLCQCDFQTTMQEMIDNPTTNEAKRKKKVVENFDKVLDRFAPLEHDCVVYRSVNGIDGKNRDFVNSIKPGDIIPHQAYVATATEFNNYTSQYLADNSLLMRIKLPKGTKGIPLSSCEYVLPRGAQIKVNSIDTQWGIADCEYILPQS